ncbi:MAG: hypothetical protein ACREX8_17630 [Gammaproteobacteria bacterium]
MTPRNLARLLHQLDDHEAAGLLDAAADHAPAASAVPDTGTARHGLSGGTRALSRTQALAVARQAIERNLLRRDSGRQPL